jgi:molecular chaperone IbpA
LEEVAVRESGLGPVRRSSIGFDRLFDLVDETLRLAGEDSYPPYSIYSSAREGGDLEHQRAA